MPLILLLGGARSGKSALAVDLARRHSGSVTFIATAEARDDDEMSERIAHHRAERPPEWTTLEAPLDLEHAITAVDGDRCLIVDCLSLWLANILESGSREAIDADAERTAAAAAGRRGLTIAVSNEVGMGIVPATRLGRDYRDALGRLNATWAAAADTAMLLVAGHALRLTPPSELLRDG